MERRTTGQILRDLRGARKPVDVAYHVGISVSALSTYENDRRVPPDKVKKKLAEYFGTTVTAIFFPNDAYVEKAKEG